MNTNSDDIPPPPKDPMPPSEPLHPMEPSEPTEDLTEQMEPTEAMEETEEPTTSPQPQVHLPTTATPLSNEMANLLTVTIKELLEVGAGGRDSGSALMEAVESISDPAQIPRAIEAANTVVEHQMICRTEWTRWNKVHRHDQLDRQDLLAADRGHARRNVIPELDYGDIYRRQAIDVHNLVGALQTLSSASRFRSLIERRALNSSRLLLVIRLAFCHRLTSSSNTICIR